MEIIPLKKTLWMSLMILFIREKHQGRNECKMYKLKKNKHRKERTSKNKLKYLRRLHLKKYISQLNLINKLLLMMMLLLLVRVRNTLLKKISMRVLSVLINKLITWLHYLQDVKGGDKMLNPMLSLKIKLKIMGIVWKSSLEAVI